MAEGVPSSAKSLALLHAEEFFEQNPFAYFVTRSGGTIVRVNARFRDSTGFSTEDMVGKPIEDLLSRSDSTELYGYHRAKLRYRDKTFEYECSLVRKDGSEIRAVMTMNIVVQEGFGLGSFRDVTEERRLSAEVQKRNKEIEESRARLRAALDELNRTTQLATLGEVSGRVAHEILNPLTAVSGRISRLSGSGETLGELSGFVGQMASELADVRGAESQMETLQVIQEALAEHRAGLDKDLAFVSSELARIQRLVDDMRDATRTAIERIKLSLFELLQYCREVMSEPLQRAGVVYGFECPESIYVQGDRGELIQVVTNLIRNGVEALADAAAPKEVRVVVTRRDEIAEIRVSDSGQGVPEELAPLIFEPNFTTKRGGTGLGLPIARRLLRAHGGDLELERSCPGATFLITLPCTVEQRVEWEG
jgi:PAS domain S-box-containing protein